MKSSSRRSRYLRFVLGASVSMSLALSGLCLLPGVGRPEIPSASARIAPQPPSGPLQMVALNRLMQVVTDALLPIDFEVPSIGKQARLADAIYCGGEKADTATVIALVFPAGASLPNRMITRADCAPPGPEQVAQRVKALENRPAWFAVSPVAVRWSPGQIDLAFTGQARVEAEPGALPPEINNFINGPARTFHSIGTKGLKVNLRGQEVTFDLAVHFQKDAAILFAEPATAAAPLNPAVPADISLGALPSTVNCILRAPHVGFNQFLTTSLGSASFPLDAGGQHFELKRPGVAGAANEYRTSGLVAQGNNQFNVTVEWSGADLGFQRVRLAEAEVDCGPVPSPFDLSAQSRRAQCLLRKAGAQGLQAVMNQAAPRNKPLRPVGTKDVSEFQLGEKRFALRVAVIRSTSTADSLQLFGSLALETR